MIAARRAQHRFLLLVLTPLTLGGALLAILNRESPPAISPLPGFGTFGSNTEQSNQLGQGVSLWSREDLFTSSPVRVQAYRYGARHALELKLLRPLEAPDVLLYWSPGRTVGEALPDGAHLLGRVGSTIVRRFTLPEENLGSRRANSGSLVLYSLGHQRIITSAELPAFAPNEEDRTQ